MITLARWTFGTVFLAGIIVVGYGVVTVWGKCPDGCGS